VLHPPEHPHGDLPSEMSSKVLRSRGQPFNENGNLQLEHGIIVLNHSSMEVFLYESPVSSEYIAIWESKEYG
jgi:hypothetical protein